MFNFFRSRCKFNGSWQAALLAFSISVLISGSLVLAIIDPSFRPEFAELAKTVVAGYIGSLVPSVLQYELRR